MTRNNVEFARILFANSCLHFYTIKKNFYFETKRKGEVKKTRNKLLLDA